MDFLLDYWTARMYIFSYYYPEPDNAAEIESGRLDLDKLDPGALSPTNVAHLHFVVARAKSLAQTCLKLSRRYPERQLLFEREHTLMLISRIANELLTMSLSLTRTAHLNSKPEEAGEQLGDIADIYCSAARRRIQHWEGQLSDDSAPNYAKVSDAWTAGRVRAVSLRDVISDRPPAT